jgi:cobalt-zinc-cadmium resistance protein CzcA
MIRQLIRFSLHQRLLVIGATLLVLVLGIAAARSLPIEAFPDVTDPRVQIITLWEGHAAEEMERLVTLPIERQMNGTPSLTSLRSTSMFGLSVINLVFEDGVTDLFARQQVLERLTSVDLPDGVSPSLPPLNAIGEIYRYTLNGNLPLTQLRELQDWVIEPAFRTVPWIADVIPFGGQIKQYQVDVDPVRLHSFGVTMADVENAIAAANGNAGGEYIVHGYEKQVIRGVGLFDRTQDIADVAIATRNGIPVRVSDVGTVQIGGATREGIVARDTLDDVVQAIVLMRKGGNALEVLKDVRAKAAELNNVVLPDGVKITPFYDRADLINLTMHTVGENLAIGAGLVLLIFIVFVGDWRSALVVGAVIPLSLLFAFLMMRWTGVSANLISLGAVDFGILVDASVVMVEAFLVRLAAQAVSTVAEKREVIAETAQSMGRPILFSKAILITAFLPIFTFQRVEKRIFSPMAFTLSFTLLGAFLLSMTLVPVLSTWLVRGQHHETRAARLLTSVFRPALSWCLAHARVTIAGALTLLVLSLGVGSKLGTEFLPTIDEGNIWLRVTMPGGISLNAAKDIERQVRARVNAFPQVRQTITQLGRPDDGTDTKGANNLELYIDLKPRGEWGDVRDKETLVKRMHESLSVLPGLDLNFSQYIKDNIEEALTGVTGELVVKIFGPDLQTLQDKAGELQSLLARIPGVADLAVEQQFGQPQLRFVIDREAIARLGVSVADVNDAIESSIGGKVVTQFLETAHTFDVRVRYAADARTSTDALSRVQVNSSLGPPVPLSAVTRMINLEGASRISREANERRIAIKWSVRGRDQGGFVTEAQQIVERELSLPPGYRMTWGGQFENQRRATARLSVVVPTSILLIFILLFSAFGSTRYAALILATLPFSLIGGLALLWVRDINLSVSAAMGFIVLFGMSVQNGVILVSEFNALRKDGLPMVQALMRGTLERLRPVMMTALMAALGLLPAALSTGVGAETIRPFATVIVGGLASATVLTLLLLPVLYRAFHERETEE